MSNPDERPCPRLYPHPPHKYMHQRRSTPCPGVAEDANDLYFCPTVGEIESHSGGGFTGGTCCAHPDTHVYLGRDTPGIQAISSWLSEKAKADYAKARQDAKVASSEHPRHADVIEHVTRAIARHDLVNMVGLEPHQDLPDPNHSFWSLWRATAEVAVVAYNEFVEGTGHIYLATSCRHGEHGYCQANTGAQGDKVPAVCKFCRAPCICSCHALGKLVDTSDWDSPEDAEYDGPKDSDDQNLEEHTERTQRAYVDLVSAPLSKAAIEALNERLAAGDAPRRKVARKHTEGKEDQA